MKESESITSLVGKLIFNTDVKVITFRLKIKKFDRAVGVTEVSVRD